MTNRLRTTACALVLSSVCQMVWPSSGSAEAIPVELRKTPQGWQLLRGGKPYFIRGAGGDGSLEERVGNEGGRGARFWGPPAATKRALRAKRRIVPVRLVRP